MIICTKANMIQVVRVKPNIEDNSYDLIFDGKYNLEHIHITTNVLNSNPKYVVHYLDDNNRYTDNFVMNNDEIQHQNIPDSRSGQLIINKPRIQGNRKALTSSIKVKLVEVMNLIY